MLREYRLTAGACIKGFLFGLLLLLYASLAPAGTATLSWIAPTTNTDGSPLTDLAGYIVQYGTSSGIYPNSADVGNVTAYQVNNLADGVTYYFTVVSYNKTGNRSDPSLEVSKTTPPPAQYVLSVAKTGTGTGSVSSSPAGVSCGSVCSGSYAAGTTVTLTASPDTSSVFGGWSGACSGTGTCTVAMSSARSVTAAFALRTYTITASAGTGGSISPSGTVSVNSGGNGTFTITPSSGYSVADVTVDGSSAGAVSSYTFTNVTADHNISASFAPVVLTSAVSCNDGGIPCVERADGGSDADNLTNGMPKMDVEYIFSAVVVDRGGTPQSVSLYLADRGNPSAVDFNRYAMTCSGDFSAGAVCTYRTQLGPAAGRTFYIGAELSDGSPATFPQAGYIDGPRVQLLNGFNIVGAPLDLRGAYLDGAAAFSSDATYRWVYTGQTASGYNGQYEAVDTTTSPAAPGEGYFVKRAASPYLPGLEGYPAIQNATYTIPIQPGWNLISNPFDGNVDLADLQIKKGTAAAVSWVQAVINGWLDNAIYYYTGSDWGSTYGFASVGGTTQAVLIPWRGYWLHLNRSDDGYWLIFPKP